METWVEELPKEKFFPRVNAKECLVTISMLISNRIDTVEKCFESFRPLLEQISSEFIAVDTVGDEKSDGSVDVARRYADKIVHFEWCDDFSAARNAGLKEAHGKWLIYLDDDEWFDNIGPLIDFFSKPELYQNYDRVCLPERSYTSAAQIDYITNSFARIGRIVPESRFVNPVHELLKGVECQNEYELKETFIHHVGYIGEKAGRKSKRNKDIMNRKLEQDPGNLHLWVQQVAGVGDDRKELLDVSERAVRTIRKMSLENWAQQDWIEIYLYQLNAYARFRMWDKLNEGGREFAEEVSNPFYLGVLAKFMLSEYMEEDDEKETRKWLEIYWQALLYCEKNNKKAVDVSYFFSNEIKPAIMYRLIGGYFSLCRRTNEKVYEKIKDVIVELPWQIKDKERGNVLACALKETINAADYETFCLVAREFTVDGKLEDEFMEQLDRIRLNLESETAVDSFMRVVSSLELDNDTLWLMQHLDDEVSHKKLDENLSPDISAAVPNECLIELCVSNGISPQKYVENMSWEDFTKTVSALLFKFERHIDVIPEFAGRIEESWEPSAYRNYLLADLRRRYIFQDTMLFSKVMSESESYCRNMIDFAGEVYSEKLCEIVSPMLPAEIRFAIVFGRALEFRRSGMVQESLECLKQALDIFKYSETLVKRIIQEISLEQRRHTAVSDELVRLGNQVKAQITVLISQGQIEVAKSLLDELKQITPDDGDIVTLEKLCR